MNYFTRDQMCDILRASSPVGASIQLEYRICEDDYQARVKTDTHDLTLYLAASDPTCAKDYLIHKYTQAISRELAA